MGSGKYPLRADDGRRAVVTTVPVELYDPRPLTVIAHLTTNDERVHHLGRLSPVATSY